jgi:hypothetical protein
MRSNGAGEGGAEVTDLEEVVINLDKRIEKMNNLIAANPSDIRKGIKMAYEDAREMCQNMRQRKGELP